MLPCCLGLPRFVAGYLLLCRGLMAQYCQEGLRLQGGIWHLQPALGSRHLRAPSAVGMKGAGARGGMWGRQQCWCARCCAMPLVQGGLQSSCLTREDGQQWAWRSRNLLAHFVGSVKSNQFLKMGHTELHWKTFQLLPLGQMRRCGRLWLVGGLCLPCCMPQCGWVTAAWSLGSPQTSGWPSSNSKPTTSQQGTGTMAEVNKVLATGVGCCLLFLELGCGMRWE